MTVSVDSLTHKDSSVYSTLPGSQVYMYITGKLAVLISENIKPKPLKSKSFGFVLARLKEFESPTFRLGGGRSIQLSYRRISIVQFG